ncbi:hypothetical protein BJ165DRAFT_1519802 [Panaeolus papilionaceus]|nr:hypothetical protein BJ165DRAFT_1519802 [Panaeolus papilionaceus]
MEVDRMNTLPYRVVYGAAIVRFVVVISAHSALWVDVTVARRALAVKAFGLVGVGSVVR